MEIPQVKEWGEANKPRALSFLDHLDGELKTRSFIAGNDYSVADITAMIAIDFLRVSKLAVPDALTNVKRWYAAVSERPSSKA
jgi:glutathione S-transferase